MFCKIPFFLIKYTLHWATQLFLSFFPKKDSFKLLFSTLSLHGLPYISRKPRFLYRLPCHYCFGHLIHLGTFAVFSSKLHIVKYNSLLSWPDGNILLWTREESICDNFFMERSIKGKFWSKNSISYEKEFEKVGQLFQVNVINLHPYHPWQWETGNSLRALE